MTKNSKQHTIVLSISLPSELARAVARRVEAGLYASPSEVIHEALRLLLDTETESPSGKQPSLVNPTLPIMKDEDNQLAPGLRLAPERLKKLQLPASSSPRE